MGRTILLLCAFLTLQSCNHNGTDPERVANRFYDWYLDDVYLSDEAYLPEFVVKDNHFILDTVAYFKFLRSSGYFSEAFISNESQIIRSCNTQLETIPAKHLQDYAVPSEGIPECVFMEYDLWVGCQGEIVDKVEVIGVIAIPNNRFRISVVACDTIEMVMSEQGSELKIDRIFINR
jgi:hypothetical protein